MKELIKPSSTNAANELYEALCEKCTVKLNCDIKIFADEDQADIIF